MDKRLSDFDKVMSCLLEPLGDSRPNVGICCWTTMTRAGQISTMRPCNTFPVG